MVTFYFRRGASASEFSLFFLSHSALGVYMHTYTHARALYTPWPCTFSTFAAVRDFESCVAEINGAFRIYLAHARSLHFSFRFDSSLAGAEDRLLFFPSFFFFTREGWCFCSAAFICWRLGGVDRRFRNFERRDSASYEA